MTGAEAAPETPDSLDIRVVRGSPSAEELAALTAVISGVIDELADDQATRALRTTTAWYRSQRRLRVPLEPGAGAWRGFTGH